MKILQKRYKEETGREAKVEYNRSGYSDLYVEWLETQLVKLFAIPDVSDTVYDPDWEMIQTAPHGIQYKHKKTGETKWE